MKIRPKNNILYAKTGVKFSSNNTNGANWNSQVFTNIRQHLLDSLSKDSDDYGYWLNEMQGRHANLYNLANQSGNWQDKAYENDLVGQYQNEYSGNQRSGTYNPGENYKTNFNYLGIVKAQEQGRYNIGGPKRTSGDYGTQGYKADNLYSAITDDRRLLGRKGDWDENSEEFKKWQSDLKSKGWETYLDPSDNYYKLRRITQPNVVQPESNKNKIGGVEESHKEKKPIDWSRLNAFFPDMLEAGRLAGNLNNNEKVYKASLAGIRPNLAQSYNTHRQVVGDEASKQSYYRMAAQGQSKAARPFTADADKQMAYMMEAKRIGDELRAKGDQIDNAEIRRTSEESNQHQWDNLKRDTEVANANIVQLNAANAAKQNLLANKYTADWTSWDNYLKSKEYRMRSKQAENDSIQKQIATLQYQIDYDNDKELARLKEEADEAYEKNDADAAEKMRKYRTYKTKKTIEYYQGLKNSLFSAKSGMKFEYKGKEDLLYKSAKDTVEHFRKMVKMSDDSIQKSRKKPIKLSSHPKTKKMQQGGVAPFSVFTPVALGGETSAKTAATSSSEKSKSSDSLDLVKKLFQDAEGLPIDVNLISSQMAKVLKKAHAFGEELSSSNLETLYLQSMQQINQAKHSKSVYDQAKKIAIDNDAMGEFAVTSDGSYIVQDTDGKIGVATLEELQKKKLNPLTNGQLISMREVSPNLAFSAGDNLMETVISNGIGMTKIAEQLTKLKGTLGSSEQTIEGYTRKESNDIKKGMELLADAPKGIYKYSQYTKDQQEQMKQAYGYIVSMLPKNMKAILTINAYKQGTTPDKMISYLLNAGASNASKFEIDAIAGKGSKSSSEVGGGSKLKYDAASALISGEGYNEVMEFNTGTSYAVKVNGRHTEFQKHSGENMGQCTMDEALQSTLKGVLDFNKATFGGSRLNSSAYNHILINDGTVIGVDLPVDNNGDPDFSMLKKLQTLDQVLLQKGIEDTSENAQQVNAVCQEIGLPAKYNSNGKLNSYNWGRFAAFQATTDESALQNKSAILGDMVKVADDQTRESYKGILQSKTATKKYDISDGFLGFGWGKDELYQGTIFVPVKSSYAAAAMSSGQGMTLEDITDVDMKAQGYDQEKASTYKPGYKLSDLENE